MNLEIDTEFSNRSMNQFPIWISMQNIIGGTKKN